MKSYSSLGASPWRRVEEILNLYRMHGREPIAPFVTFMRDVEKRIALMTGVTLKNLDVLDVGCGQQMRHARYFARHNRVTAIDMNVIPQGLGDYWTIAKTNGPLRALKTAGRKLLRIDSAFANHLEAAIGERLGSVRFIQMDAARMTLADCQFDAACSFSVFEHLPDPEAVTREVARVLKPGGVAYLSTHLYTSFGGAHDPRVLSGDVNMPVWAHMRPSVAHLVQPNSYCNQWRMARYKSMFEKTLPGVQFHLVQSEREWKLPAIAELRRAGEFTDLSDDELVSDELVAVWQKPTDKLATTD